ncbi:MAG: Bug family tripartite tricarboxylate transporter substrate binding protein [Xanthobacteraceae bacterium]
MPSSKRVGSVPIQVLFGLILVSMLSNGATADPVADFYRGQTITLLVGANTGGGYDAYARPTARHLGRFIPGEPNIVIKYMPAAASIPAANTLYSVSSKDGLTMGMVQRHIPFEQLRGNKNAKYDPFKFHWLGSLASEVSVTLVWATAPHQSAQDILTKPLVAGSLGPQTDSEIESNAMINLLGAPINLVRGYSGTSETLLAVERGELQGVHGISWSYIKSRKADWLRDKKIRILLQTGLHPHQDLKTVSTLFDLVKSKEDRQVWELIFTPKLMSRPFVLPPDVPADRVAALRAAFERMVKDEAFLADMKKIRYEVSFISGSESERLIKRVYAFPPAVVEKMKVAIQDKPSAR